jgi:hypothetical protein
VFINNVSEFIGVEANPAYSYLAQRKTRYLNPAVVDSDATSVELNVTRDGLGSSIHGIEEDVIKSINFPAMRRSSLFVELEENGASRFIIRMNIVGAEFPVLRDLSRVFDVSSGKFFWPGKFDDGRKLDLLEDLVFQRFLKREKITRLPLSEVELRPRYNVIAKFLLKWRGTLIRGLVEDHLCGKS